MASITRTKNGRRILQFMDADGVRRSIRLGKVTHRTAEEIKTRVEHLNAAKIAGIAWDGETAEWVAKISDDLARRLAAVGLIPKREKAKALGLGEFLEEFIAGRPDVKKGTRTNYGISRDRLIAFFGAEKGLRDITEGDVDAWVVDLRTRYAQATVSRTIKHARQFFKSAVRRRLIPSNPFVDVKAGTQTNTSRSFFVTREMATGILDACPDHEWRLLFALSRFGGLRCPSEHLGLRWEDIDWERGRMLIRSPKKEHLEDAGERWVPIFPELRPYLDDAFEMAEPGAVYVTARYRDTNVNLRTRLIRIIRRAGIKPWPRLFQNLRATRETELAESFPLHVVCEWIGNSAKVAADHYLQVTEEHFRQALQNPVQQCAATPHIAPKTLNTANTEPELFLRVAESCDSMQADRMTPTGFEPVSRP